ncbi:hypothetical protein ACFX2H_021314 [Malus domestica]
MKTILSSETTDIPDGVKIKVHAKIIEIEGSCGNLICNFKLLLQIMELSNRFVVLPYSFWEFWRNYTLMKSGIIGSLIVDE